MLDVNWLRERIDRQPNTYTSNAERNAWIGAFVAHEILRRWYTPLGIVAMPRIQDGSLGSLHLENPLCLREPHRFGRIELDEGLWGTGPEVVRLPAKPGAGGGHLRGFDVDDELKQVLAGLDFGMHVTPGHERCFHRRGKSFEPIMWTVALLLRTYNGRSWASPRTWETIYNPQAGAELSFTNGHSMSPLRDIMGDKDPVTGDALEIATDSRLLVVYEWGIGTRAPGVVLRNDGWAFVGTRGTINVGTRWRAGESLVDLATELSELAGLPMPGA